jgi:hypothetical protein
MIQTFHYEVAMQDYLLARGCPHVAVDEAKRKMYGAVSLKNLDFIVYSETGSNMLVDVKGRKFPDTRRRQTTSHAWENWVTTDDVESMHHWQGIFGEGFTSVFVFVYWLQGPPQYSPFEDVYFHDGRHYAFMGIDLGAYREIARPRSARWETLSAPAKVFSRLATPLEEWL